MFLQQSMQPESPNPAIHRFRRLLLRCAACLIMLTVVGLLVVAAKLQPSPSGLGTHQQLGLPPCTMRVVFELRCPACGMTTAWAHFVRGQWRSSIRVNLGGFLLAIYGLGLAVACARVSWTGSLPDQKCQFWGTLALLAVAGLTVLDWASRLLAERFL